MLYVDFTCTCRRHVKQWRDLSSHQLCCLQTFGISMCLKMLLLDMSGSVVGMLPMSRQLPTAPKQFDLTCLGVSKRLTEHCTHVRMQQAKNELHTMLVPAHIEQTRNPSIVPRRRVAGSALIAATFDCMIVRHTVCAPASVRWTQMCNKQRDALQRLQAFCARCGKAQCHWVRCLTAGPLLLVFVLSSRKPYS